MHEPIAIIGMACRFPGAPDLSSFQRLLREGGDAVGPYPVERNVPGMSVFPGGYLRAIDRFDASFFNISPREARAMDPQQRILLELTQRTLEHAGVTAHSLAGRPAGVYVGISTDDYARLQMADARAIDVYSNTGSAFSISANRISYHFNLRGPSMAVDTACSSSLSALKLACDALVLGEIETALVGAVNLILEPAVSIGHGRMGLHAGDGKCKPFDARADGIVRSEGAGMLLLKPLWAAVKDGDVVQAVLRGMAVNQDGRSNGLTGPSGKAQQEVLQAAYAAGAVSPGDIAYVETHGTGTLLGDPIEARALGNVLNTPELRTQACRIGSVKSNIGHTEAAAGMAGLFKTVLMLKHGEFLPSIHFDTPNPHIPFADLGLHVQTKRELWQGPLLAGVSSFGFGGSNAHVVIEGPPHRPRPSTRRTPVGKESGTYFLPLSARSPEALSRLVGNWREFLNASGDDVDLKELCAAAAMQRDHYEHRFAAVFSSREELLRELEQAVVSDPVVRRPRLVFVFSGQGALYPGMAVQLFRNHPSCVQWLEECGTELRNLGAAETADRVRACLTQGSCTDVGVAAKQVLLFIVQTGLLRLFTHAGIEPNAVVGHSLGEIAGAVACGAIEPLDGLRIAYHRGRACAQPSAAGVMVAMEGGVAAWREIASGHTGVDIAADNGPDSVILSGGTADMERLLDELRGREITHRRLKIDFAAHGRYMTHSAAELRTTLENLKPQAGRIDFFSATRGARTEGPTLDADFWADNAAQPVLFAQALGAAATRAPTVFLELSHEPLLSGVVSRMTNERSTAIPTLTGDEGGERAFIASVAALYERGIEPNFQTFFGANVPVPVQRSAALPGYPFQRERFWFKEPSVRTPMFEILQTALRERSRLLPVGLAREHVLEQTQMLNEIALMGMAGCLRSLGFFADENERHERRTLVEHVDENYAMLFDHWLRLLVEEDFLQERDGLLVCPQGLPPGVPAEKMLRARKLFLETPLIVDYLENCVKALPHVVRGNESPLETLFPRGEFRFTDALYHEWPVVRFFNELVSTALRTCLTHHAGSVRILEVGGGTGGTTRTLLPLLPPHRVEYEFTDVSDFFIRRARELPAFPDFVRYALLDLEKEPADQGIGGDRDVIIAANVVHAARDIGATLKRLKSLLTPGGMLVLYETTLHHVWFNATTALIEGWRKFDDAWREEHPLLNASQWRSALESADFVHVTAWPEVDSPLGDVGQNVIIAFRPDVEQGGPPSSIRLQGDFHDEAREGETAQAAGVPGSDLEQYLRVQLGRVLRMKPGGIHGEKPLSKQGLDSLMMVELRNRLRVDLRRELSVQDLKGVDTLDKLVQRLESMPETVAENTTVQKNFQGPSEPVPLSPPQAWFFEHELKQPHYWNVTLLLECENLDFHSLRNAAASVFAQHEVFSLRFTPDAKGDWSCVRQPDCESPPVIVHDLSREPKHIRARRMEKVAARVHASLNITHGPPAGMVLFSGEERDRLFITIHHLYIDGFAWLAFLEDLEAAYHQARAGRSIAPAPDTGGYVQWARELEHRAHAGDWSAEKRFWMKMHESGAWRLPAPDTPDREGDAVTIAQSLGVRQTEFLTSRGRPVPEFLLSALRRAFSLQYGPVPLFLETEGHGRAGLDNTGDNARLIGWCNTFHPLLLQATDDQPDAIAERIQALPEGGRNYGLIRYLRFAREFRALPAPQIKFMYHGRLPDQAAGVSSLFRRAPEAVPLPYGPDNRPGHLLYFYASISEARLRLEIVHGKHHFEHAVMKGFLSRIVTELEALDSVSITKKT